MTPSLSELGLDRLPPEVRLAVAEALWQSVAEELESAPISAAQREELELRLAASIEKPDAATPWELVKARAIARGRSSNNATSEMS